MTGRWPGVLLVGDIGGPSSYHAGDEAMVSANLEWLREGFPGTPVTLLSKDPSASSRIHGCPAVLEPAWARRPKSLLRLRAMALRRRLPPQLSIFAGIGDAESREARKFFDAISGARVLFFSGGGNLTSRYSGEVRLRTLCALLALKAGATVVAGGQTLGPITRQRDAVLLASWLPRVALLGLRDGAGSLAVARSLGVPAEVIEEGPDDAWSLAGTPAGADLLESPSGEPLVGCSIHVARRGGLGGPDVVVPAARAVERLAAESEARIIFLPHHFSGKGEGDVALGLALREMLPLGSKAIVPNRLLLDRELKYLTSRCDLVISTRYHGAVFALSSGVPCLGISQDEHTRAKLEGAFASAGLAHDVKDIRDEGLTSALLDLWRRRGEFKDRLAASGLEAAARLRARRERLREVLSPLLAPPGP